MSEQSLQIDLSGRLGLAPRFWGDIDRSVQDPNFRYIGKDGMMAQGMFNPFRKLGYLSAANTAFTSFYGPASTDYVAGANWTCSIYDAENQEWYFGLNGRYLHKAKLQDGHTSDSTAVDLGNSGYLFSDLEIYQVNGARKIFAIYKKLTTLEIAISDLTWNTGTDDLTWLTTTVSGAFSNTVIGNPFMRVADNGFAYLFNGNQVHMIDGTALTGGTNGTVTPNALLFPVTFRITDALDNRGAMYIAVRDGTTAIGANVSGTASCGVYVWDRSTTTSSSTDFIQVRGVKDIKRIYVAPSGALRIIVLNADDVAQIREYNGNTFVPIAEVGNTSSGGGAYPIYHDSFAVANNFVTWVTGAGYIFAHGSVLPGDPEGIFLIGKLPSSDPAANGGAILYLGGNEYTGVANFKAFRIGLIVSYLESSTTTNAYIKLWDMYGVGSTGNATGVQNTDPIYTLVNFLPQMSTVKHIDLYMGPSATSTSTTAATVKIYFNQSATEWASKAVTLVDCAKGYKRIEINKPYVNSIQLSMTHGGVTMGQSEFFPAIANVVYEHTVTKG